MEYEGELAQDCELVERILAVLPPAPAAASWAIRTSRQNVDRALYRALARAARLGELITIELVNHDVSNSETS